MIYSILFIVCYLVAAISLSCAAFYAFLTASRHSGEVGRNMNMIGMCLVTVAVCQFMLAVIRVVERVMT